MTGKVTRSGDDPGSSIVGGGAVPDQSQIRFRASDVGAPTTTPLPIVPPSAPTRLGLADALGGANPLLLWNLVPPGAPAAPGFMHTPWGSDFAWRWQQHQATPVPALGLSPYMSVDSDGLLVRQAPIASGGGSYIGNNKPYMVLSNSGPLVDPSNTPVWTIAVEFDSEAVQVDGTAPPSFSSGTTPPYLRLTAQPVIGNTYTNSPWILYVAWGYSWIGGPGAWSLVLNPRLALSVGGSGGPTQVTYINGMSAGIAYVELDATDKTILLYGGTFSGVPPTSGHGDTMTLGTGVTNYQWPGDFNGYQQSFAGGNMGAYYWASYRQLSGHIQSVAAVALSAEDTVTLVSQRSLVPGTGPVVPNVKFRSGDQVTKPLSAELSEYTHYWPLDDKSPGPMYDLLAGAYLTVINPTLATFQTDGFVNPVNPAHTKAIRLARGSRTNSYLTWNGSGPRPSLGVGGVGHDLTVAMWIRWEGPVGGGAGRRVIQGSYVPFGFGQVPSYEITIYPYVEPFGVAMQIWDDTAHQFVTLKTEGFDWPADYLLFDGGGSLKYDRPIPYKGPVWAYLTCVMRTVSGHMTMEIWVDGVMIAQQVGGDNGWGHDVALTYVGDGITPVTLKDLTIWPFALSADAISGAGA